MTFFIQVLFYTNISRYWRLFAKHTGWEERQISRALLAVGEISCPGNLYFSQINPTNRIYLVNYAEYSTTIQISSGKIKIILKQMYTCSYQTILEILFPALCYFLFSIIFAVFHPGVINYLEKGFSFERGYLPSIVVFA